MEMIISKLLWHMLYVQLDFFVHRNGILHAEVLLSCLQGYVGKVTENISTNTVVLQTLICHID